MKSIKRYSFKVLIGLTLLFVIWWISNTPPDYIEIAPAYEMSEVPDSIQKVKTEGDPLASNVEILGSEVPGYDDLLLQEHLNRAFATGMDGWIWKIDLTTGAAEAFVDPPLMASGIHSVPGTDDRIYFCTSHLYGETYPEGEKVGLYELEISTKTVRPLLTRVPLSPPPTAPVSGNEGELFVGENQPGLLLTELDDQNSRLISFCNDLDVSLNGDRIYFSSPFDYEGASMGGGAFQEAISLGNHGKLWMYDLKKQKVSLIAQGYNFIDGVLIEDPEETGEKSLLISETTKFRILRFYLSGERAGQDEVVWDSLPGMPDGLDRDGQGRVWVGLLKNRSKIVTWLHGNPWMKPFFLRLPHSLLPIPKETGLIVFNTDASIPLYYTKHQGSVAGEISVVIPGSDEVYLANFKRSSRGIFKFPYPKELVN